MESIIRKVQDIDNSDRRAIEHVLGRQLTDDQQVIIQIVTAASQQEVREATTSVLSLTSLPPWCNVYTGLSEQAIREVEEIALSRSNWTRRAE